MGLTQAKPLRIGRSSTARNPVIVVGPDIYYFWLGHHVYDYDILTGLLALISRGASGADVKGILENGKKLASFLTDNGVLDSDDILPDVLKPPAAPKARLAGDVYLTMNGLDLLLREIEVVGGNVGRENIIAYCRKVVDRKSQRQREAAEDLKLVEQLVSKLCLTVDENTQRIQFRVCNCKEHHVGVIVYVPKDLTEHIQDLFLVNCGKAGLELVSQSPVMKVVKSDGIASVEQLRELIPSGMTIATRDL